MIFFEEATLRLKQQLHVQQDKDVARILGLSPRAWAGRKKADSFPEKELRALAQRQPGLELDVDYVLEGKSSRQLIAKAALNMPARWMEIRGERTVEAFAQVLGTAPQDIAAIEAGERLPGLELNRKLIEACPDKDLAWLLGGDSPTLDRPLTGLEVILVMNYRNASAEGQEGLRRLAAFHAEYARNRLSSST